MTAPGPQPPADPALCGRLVARVTGHVASPAAQELSGLVLSRSQPQILWSHNDSGDVPRVLAFTTAGRLRADIVLPGAASIDWEDIALAPAANGPGTLFLGDIGDNGAERSEIVVYRTPEPVLPRRGVLRATTPRRPSASRCGTPMDRTTRRRCSSTARER